MISAVKACPWCGSFYRTQTHCLRDGQPLVESDGVIERYRILDRVGDGGMGVVYKAEHSLLDNRIVALKMLHREHAADKDLVNRFFLEARAASRVENEHIVKVFDFGVTEDGDCFLVMEFLAGQSLRSAIEECQGPMELERAYRIGIQIAEGLYAAHRKGIVHRDLKPENVLLEPTEDGAGETVKLLDFGIALLTDHKDARLTRAGMILGTPAYMSPEQASGQPVDQRTDVYALGTILYEMLAGTAPFVGQSAKEVLIAQLTKQPRPPKELRAEIPTAVQAVILRALSKEADDRPKTAMHLAYELRDALTRKTGSVEALGDDEVWDLDGGDEGAGGEGDGRRPTPVRGRKATRRGGGAKGAERQGRGGAARGPRWLPPRQWLWVAGMGAGMLAGVALTLALVDSGEKPGGPGGGRVQRGDATAGISGGARRDAGTLLALRPGGKPGTTADTTAAGTRVVGRMATDHDLDGPKEVRAGKSGVRAARASGHPRRGSGRKGVREPGPGPAPPPSAEGTGRHVVTVTSRPPGAEVYERGHRLGRTPLKLSSGQGRELSLFKNGYTEGQLRVPARGSGTLTATLSKDTMSWDVMSLSQLKRLHDKGQISRFTYQRRKSELMRKRDAALLEIKLQFKMGQISQAQFDRQVQAINASYR
ncbi:MAG: serine/threonine protein kinase [Deltaproteobacteria bacterium]|nr:serine/threonine protein kinase [Deltaproteobacteria bacterium]